MDKLIYDVGASNIKFALMTDRGEILERRKIPTPRESLEEYLKAFTDLAAPYAGRYDAVGISTNGRMQPDGNTYRAYTMNFLMGIDIKKELEQRLGVPVVVENDGQAATIGEWWMGAGQGADTVIGIVLGSSIGGGMIVDGKPWRGTRRNGAMVFTQLTSINTAKEKYGISALGASFMLYLAIAAKLKFMRDDQMTGEKFFELLEAGDRIVTGMFRRYCRAIAVTVYNNALLLDPDKVIITGGLAQRQVLIEGIREALRKIADRCMIFKGIDLRKNGLVHIDTADLEVDCTQGALCLDANLYGALYCVLKELGQL